MTKEELLEALEGNRQELEELLETLPDETMLEPGVVGTWSIKDILAHLSAWEAQIVTMLFQISQGIDRPTTAHFRKETVDVLNQRWHESSKDRPLDMVWQDWLGVRKQTIRRVSEMSERDLTDPRRYGWLREKALWEWIAGDSIDHEDEHADAIREWLDQRDPG